MDNLELFTKFCHYFIIQIRAVVSDNPAWHTILTYKINLDKAYYPLLSNISILSCSHPFGEVVSCHQDKTMSIRRLRFNHSNHVNTPYRERPWGRNNIEESWRHMNLVSINLTLMALLRKFVIIRFQCHPIVTCPKHLFCH